MVPMTFRLAMVCGLVGSAVAYGSAEDPTKTLPDAYQTALENDYVRVVRVHYDAGVKLPEHTHPGGTTVYVYLNDSDGVVFRHSGRSNRAVTRPAVKAGGVRIASGEEEHHTAENPASTPSDFLRVMFKTDNAGERNLRRRLSPTDAEFTNKQMRITRVTVVAGTPVTLAARAEPSLLIAVASGDVQWLDADAPVTLASPGEFLRLDFLTPPQL